MPGIHVFLPGKHQDVDGRVEPGHDGNERQALNAPTHTSIDETSARYEGWRIVVVCFLVATFGWGLGFYGQSVYVAELHRLHGWPASLISGGTTFFYLFGALLVVFVSEAIRAFGPRNCLLAGIFAMAAAAVLIGQVTEPWQLYAANAVLAFGWAGTSLGIITNTLGLWFDKKRGMAISLALNGASFGGIAGVPLLVAAIGSFGFSGAMIVAAIAMVVLMVPVILIFVGRPPLHPSRRDRSGPGGCAVGDAGAGAGLPRHRLSLGLGLVRAGAVRAGRLHRPPDLVPGFGDGARTRGVRGRADDRDGGGRPGAVLLRDRPAQPAAGLGDLVRQPGRGARHHHQCAERHRADRDPARCSASRSAI